MVVIALVGHDLIVRVQRLVVPVATVVLLAGFAAYAGTFDGHRTLGEPATGGHWSTWVLVTVLAAAGPISYARRSATTPGASPAATATPGSRVP
jgi:purine-cytosine permease-like protein